MKKNSPHGTRLLLQNISNGFWFVGVASNLTAWIIFTKTNFKRNLWFSKFSVSSFIVAIRILWKYLRFVESTHKWGNWNSLLHTQAAPWEMFGFIVKHPFCLCVCVCVFWFDFRYYDSMLVLFYRRTNVLAFRLWRMSKFMYARSRSISLYMGFSLWKMRSRESREYGKYEKERERETEDANCSTNAFILLRSWAAINVVYVVWYPDDIEIDASAFVCISYLALSFSPLNLFRSLSLSRLFFLISTHGKLFAQNFCNFSEANIIQQLFEQLRHTVKMHYLHLKMAENIKYVRRHKIQDKYRQLFLII